MTVTGGLMHERAGSPDEGRIVATPGVVSGRPRLAGTRIFTSIFWSCVVKGGLSVDDACGPDYYPDITRADVLAAIAYEYGRRSKKKLPTE